MAESAVALEVKVTVVPALAVCVAGEVVPVFTRTALVTPAVVA